VNGDDWRAIKAGNVKSGRNDPCPCGSGKKYKKCCGQGQPDAGAAPLIDLNEIVRMIQAGRYAELETEARAALHQQPQSGLAWKALSVSLGAQGKSALVALERASQLLPNDAEAHSNLGNALLASRQPGEAAASFRRALQLDRELAAVHSNLGNALRDLGNVHDAVASYRTALSIEPDLAEAHNNLGNALRALGQLDEAVASYRRALEIKREYPEALINLGNALLDLGEFGDASLSYRRALEINPELAEAHSNLGNALQGLGRLDEAAASYRRALVLKPDFAGAYSNLSDALRDLGQVNEAVISSRRALEIDPQLAVAHNSLGNALLDLGKLGEAAASYRQALTHSARFAEAHINFGMVQRLQGQTAAAEASCRRALEIMPDATAALVLLAELHTDRGQFAEAEALFRRAIEIDPNASEAIAGIPHLRRMTAVDAPWLSQAQQNASICLPRQEVFLRYAMGKYFDDVKDFEHAFENFRRANELSKRYSIPFDRQQLTQAVDRLTQDNGRDRIRSKNGAASERAVFIVGMPRSGTTLAEQILASHRSVFGAGELVFWQGASATLHSAASDAAASSALLAKLADDYLSQLATVSPDALRVIDKMPANFMALGLIHEALPDARIIHMQRHPIDTCLSIYFQHFTGHSYACDLADLAHYYREYLRIMSHWHEVLPKEAILDVPYEGLVQAPEAWSRKMLDFLGLPWDPSCLDFHRTDRSVTTASKWQVRQRISASSVNRWRNYEKFVDALSGLDAPQTAPAPI
jgi:tetratricopeptide (TPR) repeat protein